MTDTTIEEQSKPKTKQKNPRKKTHNLGELSAAYEVLKDAMASAAGVPADQVSLDGLNDALKKAGSEFATLIGVPPGKLKVSVHLSE